MQKITATEISLVANTIRILSAEAVEKAKSGHPGMPMGMAELAAVLWLKYLHFNPKDPKWLNRDRFVLSNGHGSMLLYTMLHLSGYDVSMDDLKSFRQWDSNTPGHPESFMTPGVECTTGPLGQGIANAVGMALGERLLKAKVNSASNTLIDHKVFCFLGDGCMMEGVSGEASSLAGHLGLSNLIAIYDDNHISIAGDTKLAFTEDVSKRYQAYGWEVFEIDGHDFMQIDAAFARAIAERVKPVLIIARTTIGKGSPNKAGSHESHGSPLGAEELALVKKQLGWSAEQSFFVPEAVRELFKVRIAALADHCSAWQINFDQWRKANTETAMLLDKHYSLYTGVRLEEKLLEALPRERKANSTRKLSSIVLQAASAEVPALIGGSADLEPSTLTLIDGSTDVTRESFSGKNLRFGVREHAMGSIMNGLSYYGGFFPYGSTFLCFADYMRPAIRLAALSHLPALYMFTHDSIFLGEDGPTHQPVEHLASLRAIPNLHVYRPAGDVETAVCYALALERKNGPSALILTRQNLQPLPVSEDTPMQIRKGGYIVWESNATPDVVFVATGSEVPLALQVAQQLSATLAVRVVSIPCLEIFVTQPKLYRDSVLPPQIKRVVIEAASSFGWLSLLGGSSEQTLFITMDRFGASAPQEVLAKEFGFTPDAIAQKTVQWLG